MTKKKRELIEILLDNIKPEDWPENLPYAAQDDHSGKIHAYFEPMHSNVWVSGRSRHYLALAELCKHWNKTIVHREEFMKRWNERNQSVDSEGWIQWNGGEMPVEKGTLIDVKYRDDKINFHVEAGGEFPSKGSIPTMTANNWIKMNVGSDIIAYRLHKPQQQKTPQQLALEKFGTDWHDNEGVQPVDDEVLVDIMFFNKTELYQAEPAVIWRWRVDGKSSLEIKKWRIHSETDTTTPPTQQESHTEETKPIQQEFKATDTQIDKIIAERGSNYGRFEDGAEIMQQLKLVAHTSQGWERMKPIQREGIDMILHKIGRILNGDPSYVDSWIDIEGYSKLVSDWLKGDSK